MAKKHSFVSVFGPFGPNLVPKNFYISFTPTRYYTMLQAMIV